MKGERPAGPELKEGSGRAGKASREVQLDYATERPGWDPLQDGKGEPLKGIQERWEAQWQEFLRTLQPLHTTQGSPGMSEMAPWEDTKAFLASFEQVAKACRWPRGEWAARLLPALSGEAEEAFRSLEARDQEDYGKVKAAILRGEALRMEAQRQHFRQFCCQEVRDPRRIHSQVQELCRQWLKPERHSKEQILELLILEQFLASLPVDLQGWIRAGGPDTCSQAVALAEDFLMSQKEDRTVTLQEEMDSCGSRLCLQIVSSNLPQPAQQTTLWQVLQEDGGNVEPSGNWKGSKVKMEDCQYGGNEPQDMSGKASQMGQVNVMETAEMHKERCKSKMGQETETERRENECHKVTEDLTAAFSPPSKGRTGDNMPMFSKHEKIDTILKPYKCSQCGKCFTTRSSLRRHQRNHSGEKPYKCSQCGKCFSLGDTLKRHQRIHSGEKPYKCSQCGRCFSERSSLKTHQRTHTGEKPTHTAEKPYKCSQCGKCFSEKTKLKIHHRTHSGEKPYKCSQCGKCFREKTNLKIHQRTHTGEKPYKCSQCGKCFREKSKLNRHQIIHSAQMAKSLRWGFSSGLLEGRNKNEQGSPRALAPHTPRPSALAIQGSTCQFGGNLRLVNLRRYPRRWRWPKMGERARISPLSKSDLPSAPGSPPAVSGSRLK
ncbi:zinc finger and SCAN domain-containing protein 31-like [Elgaria multicarinata webbii]|uniref:zinc finger and SCAN domain-containing protein 31-like n=1 Tax=Elgaria multicarinata webbii TaxID=159646 RepID=UPI002FCD532C